MGPSVVLARPRLPGHNYLQLVAGEAIDRCPRDLLVLFKPVLILNLSITYYICVFVFDSFAMSISYRTLLGVVTAGILLQPVLSRWTRSEKPCVPSPRDTLLPRLAQEAAAIPYPPDAFPGGRDVKTPYGTIKVFEWGPAQGEKVLILHGISTPCLSLGNLAEGLVENGCRVMLFDFFGRGYSDNPSSDVPHDMRLYLSQILLALASSELAWTGNEGFHLMGYSFGGAVAASFASYYPHMPRSLTLIAPGGLIRRRDASWSRRFLYSEGIFPERVLQYFVKRRLQPEKTAPSPVEPTPELLEDEKNGTTHDKSGGNAFDTAALSRQRPWVRVSSVIEWQLREHLGFVPAFMSAFRHGPIHDQHADWRRLGESLAARRQQAGDGARLPGLRAGKVLLVLGSVDTIVVGEEIIPDTREVLGADGVEVVMLDAGHEVVITKAAEVANAAVEFWTRDEQTIEGKR